MDQPKKFSDRLKANAEWMKQFLHGPKKLVPRAAVIDPSPRARNRKPVS
jgi:hypothetical protein